MKHICPQGLVEVDHRERRGKDREEEMEYNPMAQSVFPHCFF